LTTKLGIKNSP